MIDLTLKIKPHRPALLRNRAHTLDVLIALQAPNAPVEGGAPRMPLHLGVVIDKSGSMKGAPLDEAKRCASFVVDKMGLSDKVAVVEYDTHTNVRAPLQPVEDRNALHDAIGGITSGDSTDLHAGWLSGAKCVAPQVSNTTFSRVILLSDGCANHGLLDRDQIYSQCEALAKNGVTTSTYGLGRYFDEGLMTGIAKAGRGNAYYGQTVEDLMDPFEEELAFLANLCARNVRVIVDHPSYVRVEVLNPSWGTTEPGPVDLPDLAYESQAWVMLRLHIAGAATTDKPVGTLVDLVKVTATYQTLGGQGASVVAPTLQLPLLDPPEYGAVAIDTEVTSKGAELELARIERQAYVAAQNEQWEEVERLLNVAQATTGASDWAQKTIADLRKLLARRDREGISKEMMYSMVRKERGHGERFEDESLRDGPMQSYLRKKSSQGKADPKP